MTPAHAGVSGHLAQAGSAAGFLVAQWGLEVLVSSTLPQASLGAKNGV